MSTTGPETRTELTAAFRAVTAPSSSPQLLLSLNGRVLAANRSACSLLKRRRRELEGSSLNDWVDSTGPSAADVLRRVARSAAPALGALTVVDADGEAIDCRTEGGRLPIGDDPDSPAAVTLRLMPRATSPSRFAVLTRQVRDLRREVGRRRRAEMLLERQKELLEQIVSNRPLPEVLEAIARFIEDHSETALCSILMLSTDGRRLMFGAAPSLPAEYNAAIDGLEIGPAVGSCGTAAFRGTTVVVDDIATDPLWADFKELAAEHGLAACWSQPVTGPKGEVLATLAMYYRRPARPDADDLYLTSLGVDLAAIGILGERARAALRQRAEQLAEADRRKDRFLAMLSHELRNPLAPIVNTLEVLQTKSAEESELSTHVARLQRQTTHLSRLVDDLLDISRIAHGAIELKIDRIDLRDCLAQAVDSVREMVERRRQTLIVPRFDSPFWVDGDADRLRQVLSNLLTNASKYTEADGRIEVAMEVDNGSVVTTVSDNGRGLSPEVRRRLFEPFSQGGRSALDEREGLGLGLTLVQQLVDCHGGDVEVESEGVGKGSAFTVRLPLSARGAGPAAPPTTAEAGQAGSVLKVFVVEDNVDSADALVVLLELWGHTAKACYDGDEAVGAILDEDPHVILLDIDLPGRDGYGVLRSLRQKGFSTDERLVVAMTGFGRLQDMERTTTAGFHHHLIKPADPTLLRKLLADFAADRD